MDREQQIKDFKKEVEVLHDITDAEEYARRLALLFLGNGLSLQTILLMAIDFGQQHPHWIPVEEELPKVDDCGNSDFYLVHDFGESDHVAYYCKTDNEWYTEYGESVFPTHWMPIVPPRKEE